MGRKAPIAEVVFYLELLADAAGRTEVLLRNAAGDQGVSIKLNKQQFRISRSGRICKRRATAT